MRVLRILGIILVVILAIYLIMCLTGPKDVDVTRSTVINASPSAVYNQVADLKNWENWSPWHEMDTTMEITYGEQTVGTGASYSWTSENMGSGSLEIIETNEDNSLKTKLKFDNWDGHSYGNWSFEPMGDSTKVSWGMTSDSNIPFLMRGLMITMKSNIAKDFDAGLANLKEYVENEAPMAQSYRRYDIKMMDLPPANYIIIRDEVKFDAIGEYFQTNMPRVGQIVEESSAEWAGPPAGLFWTWDEENMMTDMAVAAPVIEKIELEAAGVSFYEMPAKEVAYIDYFGAYGDSEEAHNALNDFFASSDKEVDPPVMEQYMNDPGKEPDTAKWHTRIIYPIK